MNVYLYAWSRYQDDRALEAQWRQLRKWADHEGWTVVGHNGDSGGDGKDIDTFRYGLRVVRCKVEYRSIDAVLIVHGRALSTDPEKYNDFCCWCRDRGVDVLSMWGEYVPDVNEKHTVMNAGFDWEEMTGRKPRKIKMGPDLFYGLAYNFQEKDGKEMWLNRYEVDLVEGRGESFVDFE